MRHSFAILLLLSLVVCSSFLQLTKAKPLYPAPTTSPPLPPPSYCDLKCGDRCQKAGYYKRCMKYCGICCQQCKCVPTGTFGNKSECPCYRDKLNNKGKPKCP